MKRPIKHCLCGEDGAASNCLGESRRCDHCGFNYYIHKERLEMLDRNGLTHLHYGVRGLVIPKDDWYAVQR